MGRLILLAILNFLICCALSVGTVTKQRSSNCRIVCLLHRTNFQQGCGGGVNRFKNIAFEYFIGHGKSSFLELKGLL